MTEKMNSMLIKRVQLQTSEAYYSGHIFLVHVRSALVFWLTVFYTVIQGSRFLLSWGPTSSRSSTIELGMRRLGHSWEGLMGQAWKWHMSPPPSFSSMAIAARDAGKCHQPVCQEGRIHRFGGRLANLPAQVTWFG